MSRLGHYLAARNQMPSWFLFHDFFTEVPVEIRFPLTEQCSWPLPHGNLLSFCSCDNHGELHSERESGIFSQFLKWKISIFTLMLIAAAASAAPLCFPQLSRVVTALGAPQLTRTLPGVLALPVCGSPQNGQFPTFLEINSLQNC